jgi:hypothetical protein
MPGIWSCPLFQNPQRMRVEKVGWLDCICHSRGLRWSDSFQVQSSTMSISQVIVWSIWPLALFVRDDSNPHEFTLSHSVYSFPSTRPFHVIIERRCSSKEEEQWVTGLPLPFAPRFSILSFKCNVEARNATISWRVYALERTVETSWVCFSPTKQWALPEMRGCNAKELFFLRLDT